MRGTRLVTLELPPAAPETYLQVLRFCRLGMVRAIGDVAAEELSAGVRWEVVDQAVQARLSGRDEVAPTIHLPPDLAEILAEHLAGGAGVSSVLPGAASALPQEASGLLARCVEALERQLLRRSAA